MEDTVRASNSSVAWPYPGSRWWKFDFHTHTPKSRDTFWARSNADLSPEQWLLNYMAAEIDCLAVTDHNSGAWIDPLKDAYGRMKARAGTGAPCPGFRELTIFPGVEITASGGVHILAVFDPRTSTSDIDSLLGAVGYRGSRGCSDAVTEKTVADVIQSILDAGGIPILAHADQPKGLLEVKPGTRQCRHDATTVAQAMEVEGLLAMEWRDATNPLPAAVERPAGRLARVLGSDSHTFHGDDVPGSRYTWVKMTHPTLDGLRLALLDGNGFSVRRSDGGEFRPFSTPAHFVKSIEIKSARYMGNGHAERVDFTPYYNALIGGRGTGKSTVLHALRLAYGRTTDLNELSDKADPVRRFHDFQKVYRQRGDDGALRPDTEICAELLREGQRHRLRWRPGDPQVVVEDASDDGVWHRSQSQTINAERFPIRLFSQGQIAAMAGEDRQALLSVIDEAARIGGLHRALDEAKRTFVAQRAHLRELEGWLAERPELERKLSDTVKKVNAFAKVQHGEVLRRLERVEDQLRLVDDVLARIRDMSDRIHALAQTLSLDDWPGESFDMGLDSDILQWRKAADGIVQRARGTLEELSNSLSRQVSELEHHPLADSWRRRCQSAMTEFQTTKTQLAAEGMTDVQPDAYEQLVRERHRLEDQLKRLDQLQVERGRLEEHIAAQRQVVLEARQAITAARVDFVNKVLHGNRYVRIQVVPFGFDERAIERSLRELLEAPSRFDSDILRYDEAGNPTGGLAFDIARAADRLAAVEQVKEELQSVADRFSGHFKNFLRKNLRKPEFTDHIQCWFPDDDLRIEYSRSADGSDWAAITQGSQGQRSAALLAFLLAFGEEPLVLDQPEDDLDNHLIYDLIVRQIRENKMRRQLIIVTHNPNIVVNGDAELVHVLDFVYGQCRVVQQGGLQEESVREEVCRVMEGGREAFERRWKRLGNTV